MPAVERQGGVQVVRREVGGEGERQPQLGGQRRAEVARPEQPDRHIQALARHGLHGLARFSLSQVRHQLDQVAWKGVTTAAEVAAQRTGGEWVAAGGPAEPEVDATGVERFQGAELLGDYQRRVVGKHDAAGADTDPRGPARDEADDHGRRRAGHAGEVVVLGQPVAVIAPLLRVAGQVERVAERLGGQAALQDR
jgi:hypothetical protein